MNDEILPIIPPQFPYDPDAKIFMTYDEDDKLIWGPYSYNEYIEMIKSMAGVNKEFLGKNDE